MFLVDGGGVLPDRELDLPEDARLRVRISSDSAEDLTVYVADGKLHVVGQYRPVVVDVDALNHVSLYGSWRGL